MTLRRSRLKSTLPSKATLTPASKPGGRQSNGAPEGDGQRPAEPSLSDSGVLQASSSGDTAQRTTTSKRRLQRRVTPLVVLQEPIQAGMRKVFDLRRFLIVIGLTIGVLLIPAPPGMSVVAHRAIALFVFTGSILALEPAPLPISALMVPICQIALGIDTATGAFAPFGSPVLFLILGSLFLAEALRKHGLTRRMALYIIVATQGNMDKLLFGIMFVTGMLSMWVLNTATAAVLIPVAITIAQRVQPQEKAQRALQLLILAIAFSSSIGGMGTIMGSGENAIAGGLLAAEGEFGFLSWMIFGVPVVFILIPLSWFLLTRALPIGKVFIDTEPVSQELERLGGLKGPERVIIGVLVVSVALWMTGSTLEKTFSFLPATLLSSAVVAIGAVAYLSIEEIVDWNDLRGVNWGVFFVIGAGLTVGESLAKTGASEWFAAQLAPTLGGMTFPAILAILMLLGFTLTQFMNNVTIGAIMAPVLITLAQATGMPPASLVIPTIMSLALAFMLPSASARMTMVSVTGAVDQRTMLRTGLIVGLPSVLLLYGFFFVLAYLGLF
ncbi:MAG: SLC13 family permease [Caldilineaceae bacterium]|jgi:sodium-dependent dicarboxylate transporter 2/3/5